MNSKQQKFNQLYLKAKQKRQAGYYTQARKQYLYILNNFSVHDVDYTDYIAVMGQLGDTQKCLNLFTQSKNTYLKGVALLNEANKSSKKVSQYQIQKQRYHLYSNLGLTLCAEAQSIPDKIVNYQKFKKLIDYSLSYYKTCQEIVVNTITEYNQIEEEKQQKLKWWKNQYIGSIVNMLNPLETQAFEFQDKQAMLTMIELIQRAQKFYSLCKKKTRKHLQANISKCYYSKALCLKFLGKRQESQIYFKKDYNFCKQNNQKQDLQKTRIQLIKFYLKNFEFKNAKSYAKQSSEIVQINDKQKQYLDLMRKTRDMQLEFEKKNLIDSDDLSDLLYELNKLKCYRKAQQFNKKARNTQQFRQNQKFRYWLEYYASETYFELQSYHEALKFIKQALELTKQQPQQVAWCLLQQAIILDKIQKDRARVHKLFKQCIEKSKLANDDECKQECQNEYNNFLFRQKRSNRVFKFDLQMSKKLFDHLAKQRMKKQQQIEYNDIYDDRIQIESNTPQVIYSQVQQLQQQIPQRKSLKQLNPLATYLQNCKIMNIEPLDRFKQLLKDSTQQINLSNLIHFPSEQIMALLGSNVVIHELDLRDVVLTVQILKRINESINIGDIKELRINLINASSIQNSKQNELYYQQLKKILKRGQLLQIIQISNIYNSQKLKQIINNNIIVFESLRQLNLKQCKLYDKDLIYINISQKLPQLKKLSLSHNHLQGYNIDILTSLTQLQSLSLSANPLNNIKLTKQFINLKHIELNQLNNNIPQHKYQFFIPFIINSQTISLQNCQSICTSLLQLLIERIIQEQTSLPYLKSINLFGSVLNQNTLIDLLYTLQRKSPNLSSIDIRNCKIKSTQNNQQITQQLIKFQSIFNNKTNHFGNMQNQNPQNIKKFKQSNFKFIQSTHHKPFKNFSIY